MINLELINLELINLELIFLEFSQISNVIPKRGGKNKQVSPIRGITDRIENNPPLPPPPNISWDVHTQGRIKRFFQGWAQNRRA